MSGNTYTLPADAVLKNHENTREGCDFALDDGGTWPSPTLQRDPRPLERLLSQVRDVRDGDVIYVKSDQKGEFFERVLPLLTSSFVLVTAGEIHENPREFGRYLEDPRLLRWFGQNCDLDVPHPKFGSVPLGFTDTHIPHGDQRRLLDCHRSMPDFAAKRPVAYANFHLNRSHGDRGAARRALRKSPCIEFEKKRLSCDEVWRRHADFAFEISPRGTGLDTHRTYEALLMRTIPIVQTTTLDSLYREFPIVIVSEWDEVTPQNLELWHEHYRDAFGEETFHKLTRDCWLDRIHAAARG